MKKWLAILLIICTALILVSCSLLPKGKNFQDRDFPPREQGEAQAENTTGEEEPEVVVEEESVCGDSVCDDDESESSCSEDCATACSENIDCTDDEVCSEEGYCEEAVAIDNVLEAMFSNWLELLSDRLSGLNDQEHFIEDFLDNYEDLIDSGDFEDQEDDINDYFNDVEDSIESLLEEVDTLNDLIPYYTTRTSEEFFDEYDYL